MNKKTKEMIWSLFLDNEIPAVCEVLDLDEDELFEIYDGEERRCLYPQFIAQYLWKVA